MLVASIRPPAMGDSVAILYIFTSRYYSLELRWHQCGPYEAEATRTEVLVTLPPNRSTYISRL